MRRFDLHLMPFAVTFVAATAFQAAARAEHNDIFLAGVGGKVTVGAASDVGGADESFDLTTRLFEGLMVADFPPFDPADYGRDEPGFVALDDGASGFPPGAGPLAANQPVALSFPLFNVNGNSDSLFYWDGLGSVNFLPIATVQPSVAMTLDANPFATTDAQGGIHEHAVFELDLAGAGVPADGVYLVAPTVSVEGMTTSDRFHMVWLVDSLLVDDEAAETLESAFAEGETVALGKDFAFYETAVEFVHDHLVVPEPSTGLLAFTALAGVVVLRRRACGGPGGAS